MPFSKAYFFSDLATVRAVNDTVAGFPVLIAFDPHSENGAGFERRLNDQTLTFQVFEDDERLILQDNQTASRWNGLTGQAIEGTLQGQQLRQLPTTYAF